MPRSALKYVDVDYCVPLSKLPALMLSLVRLQPTGQSGGANRAPIEHEHDLAMGMGNAMEHLQALGHPSTFVCPECKGTLWEIAGSRPLRFRCHTGHAYTDRTLDHAQSEGTDAALWGALRALQEKRLLLECRAGAQEREGEVDDAARLHAAAQMLGEQVDLLRTWVQERQSPVEADV
jgi:two-component system chemotaxis response regulator CheB